MIILELIVVLGAIFVGARMGSIAIGYAGGFGVLILTLGFGLHPGNIPIDVILIIMSVIAAVAAMQVAGGLDYIVYLGEKVLRKHPERITFLAPVVTYFMTLFAGTGHTAYSTMPVIVEISKEQGIRPSRPLAISVVASQIAITASPISVAVVIMSSYLQPKGIGYLQLLAVAIPSTFIACMAGAFVSNFLGKDLKDDPAYQERLKKGLINLRGESKYNIQPYAKLSVLLFLISIMLVVLYATATSDTVKLIKNPVLNTPQAIMLFMLSSALTIAAFTKIDITKISSATTFRAGMSAAICVLGVAWLGDTFITNHMNDIKQFASSVLMAKPWLLSVTLFFGSMLLYSQAVTTRTLIPSALALGVSPIAALASFSAVSALFVLPTYPTLVAAVEMDDTGSTRIGKYVFNHPFLIPGVVTLIVSVTLGFLLGKAVIG